MAPLLDERSRRRWAASEARMIGHGGVSAVAEATGLARRTIYIEDLTISKIVPQLGTTGYAGGVADVNRE
jgi:FAD/FMN-containing dehydrogenase